MKTFTFLSTLAILSAMPMVSLAQSSQECQAQVYKFGKNSDGSPLTAVSKPARDNNKNCVINTPTGLAGNDLADFNHLSEGSDVYPYEWFMSLKSFSFADPDGKKTVYFHTSLDKNFGFMKAHSLDSVKLVNGTPRKIQYLVPYVGLTASWTSQRTDNKIVDEMNDVSKSADAFLRYEKATGQMKKEDQIIKEVTDVNGNKVQSIRMVGTNCSLCHSSALTYATNRAAEHETPEFRIQGAPAIVNMRGFFRDLIASTIVMFVRGNAMEEFLTDIKAKNPKLSHINPKKDAKEVMEYFCKEVANESKTRGILGNLIVRSSLTCKGAELLTMFRAAKLQDRERLYHARDAVRKALALLVRKTYNFKEEDKLGNLDYQIKYMATMGTGMKPPMEETIPGFGRTDAFGRISNLVLRGENPVDNTAPVSLPWIWGLKYMGNLHYNSNSNSVILRNVGQSLGLGAVITSDKLDTNINVHNLDRLEHLVHKIKVPEWNDVFKSVLNKDDETHYLSEFEIDRDPARLKRGYDIYTKQCASCHESNKFVGPANSLREYRMLPLSGGYDTFSPNTDPHAAKNAIIPVKVENKLTRQLEDIAFETKIFDDVGAIKARYYSTYGIPSDKQAEMEFRDLRGLEFFRDTLLGSKENKRGNDYGQCAEGLGYKARHLSGVWATSPYLHNGSVPNMMLLLTPDSNRPKFFNVESNQFDPKTLGLKNWERPEGSDVPCDKKKPREEHICFATNEIGNSNVGHNWGTKLSENPEEDLSLKEDLINFLKYLPPEPEYSWNSQSSY